jgi:hypothetical protein
LLASSLDRSLCANIVFFKEKSCKDRCVLCGFSAFKGIIAAFVWSTTALESMIPFASAFLDGKVFCVFTLLGQSLDDTKDCEKALTPAIKNGGLKS